MIFSAPPRVIVAMTAERPFDTERFADCFTRKLRRVARRKPSAVEADSFETGASDNGWFANPFEDEISDICEAADGLPFGVAQVMIDNALSILYADHGGADDVDGPRLVYGVEFDGCHAHRPSERTISQTVTSNRKRTIAVGAPTTLTDEQWARVLMSHDNRCVYCGAFGRMHLDHIVPVSKGGGTTEDNCAPACKRCNSSKNDSDVLEWARANFIDEIDLLMRLSEARRKRMEASQ